MIFFWSKILAKSDFLGSMKDVGIFWGRKKKKRNSWVAKKGLRDFFGYVRKKFRFFWVVKF